MDLDWLRHKISIVVPAQAGISLIHLVAIWEIPAFAEMTHIHYIN